MSTAASEDTEVERQNWHWRNTMRPARFFNLDARAALPFCILLFYFRLHSLILTVIITMVFYAFEKKGLVFPSALRAIRVWLIGKKRYGWFAYKRRKLKDFG